MKFSIILACEPTLAYTIERHVFGHWTKDSLGVNAIVQKEWALTKYL